MYIWAGPIPGWPLSQVHPHLVPALCSCHRDKHSRWTSFGHPHNLSRLPWDRSPESPARQIQHTGSSSESIVGGPRTIIELIQPCLSWFLSLSARPGRPKRRIDLNGCRSAFGHRGYAAFDVQTFWARDAEDSSGRGNEPSRVCNVPRQREP
jgi:hypothetical protein